MAMTCKRRKRQVRRRLRDLESLELYRYMELIPRYMTLGKLRELYPPYDSTQEYQGDLELEEAIEAKSIIER